VRNPVIRKPLSHQYVIRSNQYFIRLQYFHILLSGAEISPSLYIISCTYLFYKMNTGQPHQTGRELHGGFDEVAPENYALYRGIPEDKIHIM
jgi:hypothetical protein